MKIYAIYDRVAKESGPLFEAKNDDVAIRACATLLKDVLVKSDYSLVTVGEYNTSDCIITPSDACDIDLGGIYESGI